MFCWSLFVLLYFFFLPLCCLFFFDMRILIAPLVSSNSSFKILKGYSSVVNRRRTYNTMTKRKRTEGETTLHRKLKIKKTTNPTKTGGEIRYSGRVNSSCSTNGTRCVTLVANPMISHEWKCVLFLVWQ